MHSPGQGGNSSGGRGDGIRPRCVSITLSLGAVPEGKKTQAATSMAGAPVAWDDLSQWAPSQDSVTP